MVNLLKRLRQDILRYPIGLKSYDKNGKKTTYDADLSSKDDDHRVDITDILSAKKDDTGGGNNVPDVPIAGADYYAGSLADGEITERYLLYQRDESVAEQTNSQTVTLLRDVGSKFNMAGDGATFLIHIQKTVMSAGAKGDVTDIQLNYDPNNVAKDGYFTTTSPYLVYIKSADLATKKTLAIPINGIGENLSGKNVKAPQLNVLFNGDGTMTFESVTGYDNDGDSAGATGANYDVVIDVIATFSVQPAVAQLPPSVNLFTGDSYENIVLSGLSNFYENTMDGLELSLDNYAYLISGQENMYPSSNFGIRADITPFSINSIRIPKKDLIINNKINLNLSVKEDQLLDITYRGSSTSQGWTPSNLATGKADYLYYFAGFSNSYVQVMPDLTISVVIQFNVKGAYRGTVMSTTTNPLTFKVNKITPYKD